MITEPRANTEKDITPLNRIRVETALSRYPIHRLAKKGTISIDLQGEHEVKWEVTYNSKHGQPGPLAYKVDTLIVNRRLDELGRPLPELIKVGSLSEICRALGSSDTGPNIGDVKRSFLQNAFTAITAKVRYKTKTGREKWAEIGYTRYSVIFTGEALPDGSQADAVYIVLNPPYRDLLNHVEMRPLDYDYLRRLAPGAQRFYELLSFQVYGSVASGRPRAKMLYSDYCKYAPQIRYPDFNHMKKQMYKVHLPHRESGYIMKVDYQERLDAGGNTDWEMLYTPGSKAFAEYRAFTNRQLRSQSGAQTLTANISEPSPQPPVHPSLYVDFSAADGPLLSELTRRGITEQKARELLVNLKPGQEVSDQLEYYDHLKVTDTRSKIASPTGFLVSLIRDNTPVPEDFPSARKRRLWEESQQAKTANHRLHTQLEISFEEYQATEVERFISDTLPAQEYQRMFDQCRSDNCHRFKHMTPAQVDKLTQKTVRAEVKQSGRVPMLSFDEFCRKDGDSSPPLSIPRDDELG